MFVRFEPGDGYSYQVLFERHLAGVLLFGIAERGEAGRWAVLAPGVNEYQFFRSLDLETLGPQARVALTGWRAWRCLTGQDDDDNAAECLPDWNDDWEAQLVERRRAEEHVETAHLDLTHACGHYWIHTLTGTAQERERQAQERARQPCHDCRALSEHGRGES